MFRMEIDSPTDSRAAASPDGRILERLARLGVPQEYLNDQQHVLVANVKDKKFDMAELVSAIFPADEDAVEVLSEAEPDATDNSKRPTLKELLEESMVWLQWLMFKGAEKSICELS